MTEKNLWMHLLSLNCVGEVGINFEGGLKTPNIMTCKTGHAHKIGCCCEWWHLCLQEVHRLCKGLVQQTPMWVKFYVC